MSMSQRVQKIRSHRIRTTKAAPALANLPRQIREFQKVRVINREMAQEITDHWLATQRKPLEEVEPIALLRWLLRKYFAWRGFACRSHICTNSDERHDPGVTVECPECGSAVVVLCDGKCYASIEYRGTFNTESDARWAANCHGGEVKPIPFRAALPEETVSYGVGDVPQSEASQFYRKGIPLPFAAIPRGKLERLRKKIRSSDPAVEELRVKAV